MRKWVIPITVSCILLGFALSLQIRLQTQVTLASTTNENTTNLISMVKSNEAEIQAYEEALVDLRAQYEEMTAKTSSGQYEIDLLQKTLTQRQEEFGLTPVEGPGITVTLDDNAIGAQAAAPGGDLSLYIIHYENILSIVNDLKEGGAKAISVNGIRLVTNSEIRCVGNTILVNTTRLAPPYEIKAIGNAMELENALLTAGNAQSYATLKMLNFPVSYTTTSPNEPSMTIPAYAGSITPKYLQPVQSESEE